MSEFTGAAPYYQACRPGIPDEVTRVLVEAARKNGKAETLPTAECHRLLLARQDTWECQDQLRTVTTVSLRVAISRRL